ncbi:hypothetical protein SRHO_G00209780 [Serrasalmus rhombeus]
MGVQGSSGEPGIKEFLSAGDDPEPPISREVPRYEETAIIKEMRCRLSCPLWMLDSQPAFIRQERSANGASRSQAFGRQLLQMDLDLDLDLDPDPDLDLDGG